MSPRHTRRLKFAISNPMTGSDFAKCRSALGLSQEQMAAMLGYQGASIRQMGYDLEHDRRAIRDPQRRLILAYLSGYRPDDWPVDQRQNAHSRQR